MSRVKTKGANIDVPQSQGEAAEFIRQIGVSNRQIARIEADMNDEIAKIKSRGEARALPLTANVDALTQGLRIWCDANRARLTDNGKVKSAELGTGKVSWRIAPPKVSIKGVEDVLKKIATLGLGRFIRTKEEINKEALLAEPDVARTIKGVAIVSGVEDFAVEPFEVEIEGRAA